MLRVYGIKNCDSVKKALKFFNSHAVSYTFVDFDTTPPSSQDIDRWLEKITVDELFNAKSTTYRSLGLKELSLDERGKREWLVKENRLIKRPVIETEKITLAGYNENLYKELFL